MALLSGFKKKQKIGLDPNNRKWANDSSAFGQTLMKKMGWKEGKGLGLNETGRIDAVKASLKIDNRGLGCTPQDADKWIAHQEGFNEILAMLNNDSNSDATQDSTKESGEEHKEGAKRFYGRFSRARVQTLRTTEDLNCIMGRRKSSGSIVTDDKQIVEKEENGDEQESSSKDEEKSHGFVTTTNNCSVQDYFAQKMKEKNLKSPFKPNIAEKEEKDDDQESNGKIEEKSDGFITSSHSVHDYFAQKMKAKNLNSQFKSNTKDKATTLIPREQEEEKCNKKRKKVADEDDYIPESMKTKKLNVDISNECNDDNKKSTQTKKKKRQKIENVHDVKESVNTVNDLTQCDTGDEMGVKRKDSSRNKKDQLKESSDAELTKTKTKRDDEDTEELRPKKKCKHKGKEEKCVEPENASHDVINESCDIGMDKAKNKTTNMSQEKIKQEKTSEDESKNEECSEKKITKDESFTCVFVRNETDENGIKKDELPSLSKNKKKSLSYIKKKMLSEKLDNLRRAVRVREYKTLTKALETAFNKLRNDKMMKQMLKITDKVALENDNKLNLTENEKQEKIKEHSEKIEKLRETLIIQFKANCHEEVETKENIVKSRLENKFRSAISEIQEMSKETNVERNWQDIITELESLKKTAVRQLKKQRKQILRNLDAEIEDTLKTIIEEEKEKARLRNIAKKQKSFFHGANVVEGYPLYKVNEKS